MFKKLAKIKYLPNNFQIIENGDYVECAVSGKKISLENLFLGFIGKNNNKTKKNSNKNMNSLLNSNKNKNISLIEKYIEEPYQVDGKWFYPRDYKSYTEVGIAEIEIELNNGDLTTNKEFFHNDAHSGSHRSLPLPSILEVTWTAKSELYLPGNIASAYSLRICVIFPACFCETQNTRDFPISLV